jgi:SAM domain (Sterile alpha motif)
LFLTELEITGDVLLELDVNLLKTEFGITAFGKRTRIANAISELRRPPSISYSDHSASLHSLMHGHSNPHSTFPNNASPNHSGEWEDEASVLSEVRSGFSSLSDSGKVIMMILG